MSYTVTTDTFSSFVESFAQQLSPNKRFVVQIYDQDELVEFESLPNEQLTHDLLQKIDIVAKTPTYLLNNI
jgi:hypothetical protein